MHDTLFGIVSCIVQENNMLSGWGSELIGVLVRYSG